VNESPRTAVLLLQMGGPATLADVRPFLRSLLSDPAILAAPAFIRLPLARFIAWRRAPNVALQYRAIGGGSPIGANTARQAAALQSLLADGGTPVPVRVAMRYVEPRAATVLPGIAATGVRRLVLLPLYPQRSRTTTDSSLAEVQALLAASHGGIQAVPVLDWADDDGYVAALTASVEQALVRVPEGLRDRTLLLFSAHGLPLRYVEAGDPYPGRVAATVSAVLARLGDRAPPSATCFQSRVGPVRWLEPSTEQAIRDAAASGVRALVVVPVAFVSDHIETLYEIEVTYRELARSLGIETFVRVPALNDDPGFVAALAGIVRRYL
jgi:protoporphyrin/coproporphyrin ferrochelatase